MQATFSGICYALALLGPETHVYACLRPSPPYFDLKKIKYFINCFFKKPNYGSKTWDMHKRAFQALKRTFTFIFFFYENMVGEGLRHA